MRRTKKQYSDLYDSPETLAPGVEVILWPNGEPRTIWVKTADGLGMRLHIGNGPAGLGLTVERFTFGDPLTVSGNAAGDSAVVAGQDMDTIEVCQYRRDPWAQAFKRWYDNHDHPFPGDNPLAAGGPGYAPCFAGTCGHIWHEQPLPLTAPIYGRIAVQPMEVQA